MEIVVEIDRPAHAMGLRERVFLRALENGSSPGGHVGSVCRSLCLW